MAAESKIAQLSLQKILRRRGFRSVPKDPPLGERAIAFRGRCTHQLLWRRDRWRDELRGHAMWRLMVRCNTLNRLEEERPVSEPMIPVTACSAMLRAFAEDLQHPTTTTKEPNTTGLTDEFMTAVRDWCCAMKSVVTKEKPRENMVVEHLPKLFAACGVPFHFRVYQTTSSSPGMAHIALVPASEPYSRPISGRPSENKPPCAIIEVKGDAGVGSGEPWNQLVACYTDHVCRDKLGVFTQVTCVDNFPMILTAIDGPTVLHGAGVVSMTAVTEQLSAPQSHLDLGDPCHLVLVAASLRAWIRVIHALAAHYRHHYRKREIETSPVDPDTLANMVFPELAVGGEIVVFLEHLTRGTFRASWKSQPVVVKICPHNNDRAQRWTAGQEDGGTSLAAKILHTESLPGSVGVLWHIIVMEDLWVQGFETLATVRKSWSSRKRKRLIDGMDDIRAGVQAALDRLHADRGDDGTQAQWVFFDLRAPNVMVRRKNGVWDVRLIDFECVGVLVIRGRVT